MEGQSVSRCPGRAWTNVNEARHSISSSGYTVAFTSQLGRGQGRVRPAHVTPASGEYLFVLGEDEPGRSFKLAPGNHAEVTQAVDLTGVALVRAPLRLRVPATLPSGLTWEAALVVDGVKYARARGRPGRQHLQALRGALRGRAPGAEGPWRMYTAPT